MFFFAKLRLLVAVIFLLSLKGTDAAANLRSSEHEDISSRRLGQIVYQFKMVQKIVVKKAVVGPTEAEILDAIRYIQIFYVRHLSSDFGQAYVSATAANLGPTLTTKGTITLQFLATITFEEGPGFPTAEAVQNSLTTIDNDIFLSDFIRRAFPQDNFINAIYVDKNEATPFNTEAPSSTPSSQPSWSPSYVPSKAPSSNPSEAPSFSSAPSMAPVAAPSGTPSMLPSTAPTGQPSEFPSNKPSGFPSTKPSGSPSLSFVPSMQPSGMPSNAPSLSSKPSAATLKPTKTPTAVPTKTPTAVPTKSPTKTPTAAPVELGPSQFAFQYDFVSAPTSAQTDIKLNLERLQKLVRGDLASVTSRYYSLATDCKDEPKTVDDLFLCIKWDSSLANNVFGFAQPLKLRSSSYSNPYLPYSGQLTINANFEDFQPQFRQITEHYALRCMGVGTLWTTFNLVSNPASSNCEYKSGTMAGAMFREITGCPPGTAVPMEPVACAHWDSGCFRGNELMEPTNTGFFGPKLKLSKITAGTLQDLGYTVDYSQADTLTEADFASSCQCTAAALSQGANTANVEISYTLPLSEEGLAAAMAAGKAHLASQSGRRLQESSSEGIFVGDKVVVVYYIENDIIYDVMVTSD